MTHVDLAHTRSQSKIRTVLLLGGPIGAIQFVAVFAIEGAMRRGYDPVRDAVSLLSLTSQGIPDIVSLVVLGLLLIGMAIAVSQGGAHEQKMVWGSITIGLAGLGFIAAGIFVTDPAQGYPPGTPPGPAVSSTLHGTLHFALGVPLAFGGLTAACLIFARYFWAEARTIWTVYSVISAIAIIGGLVGFAIGVAAGGPAGLFERMSFVVASLWIMLLAVWIGRPASA